MGPHSCRPPPRTEIEITQSEDLTMPRILQDVSDRCAAIRPSQQWWLFQFLPWRQASWFIAALESL
jgi:hypothetical protein